ncbi:MAG: hypothetical protein U0136_22040 [Bdellovibrionota bacterium]
MGFQLSRRKVVLGLAASVAGMIPHRSIFAQDPPGGVKVSGKSIIFQAEKDDAAWEWAGDACHFPKSHAGFGGDTHAPYFAEGRLYIGHTGPEGVSVFDAKTGEWIDASSFRFKDLGLAGTHGLRAA